MLSRTADHLFWMARYTQWAENTPRLLHVNYQTSLLRQSDAVALVGHQAGMHQFLQVERQRACRYVEQRRQGTWRHALRRRTHQGTKDAQTHPLGQRRQGDDGGLFFHISSLMEN